MTRRTDFTYGIVLVEASVAHTAGNVGLPGQSEGGGVPRTELYSVVACTVVIGGADGAIVTLSVVAWLTDTVTAVVTAREGETTVCACNLRVLGGAVIACHTQAASIVVADEAW